MKRKIFLLEKLDRTNQQQFKRDLRLKEKALLEATEENERLREELSLKEKQVRLQVLQVKRVKKKAIENARLARRAHSPSEATASFPTQSP